jgi:hypothetical protein
VIDFNDPKLIQMHGDSWIDVQVAFYDFLFKTAIEIDAGEFNKKVFEQYQEQVAQEGFGGDTDIYQRSIAAIKKRFSTPEEAWKLFISIHYKKE